MKGEDFEVKVLLEEISLWRFVGVEYWNLFFQGLWDWVWANIEIVMRIPKRMRICGEWMKVQHHIHYNRLPEYFIAYDVLDESKNKLLPYKEKIKVLEKCGFAYVNLIDSGMFTADQIYDMAHGKSAFGDCDIEGVVVNICHFITPLFFDRRCESPRAEFLIKHEYGTARITNKF